MNIYLLQVVNGVGIGMLYFLLAVGLSIVFGLLRFVNFAHGAFYLLGAYFCYQMMQWDTSFWLALVLVPLAVGAIGWLTEKLMLRHVYDTAHEFHIVITVGLALVVQELVIGKMYDSGHGDLQPIFMLLLGAALASALILGAVVARNRLGYSDV